MKSNEKKNKSNPPKKTKGEDTEENEEYFW